MKKIITLLLFSTVSLGASAELGWLYKDSIAILTSGEEYLGNDFDNPTALTIMLESGDDMEIALIGLQSDFAFYKFRESQQYIVTDFNGERTKWEIKNVEIDGNFLKYIYVVDATKFIDKLCECDFFAITLPLAIYGTQTFYFNSNGYPLDW